MDSKSVSWGIAFGSKKILSYTLWEPEHELVFYGLAFFVHAKGRLTCDGRESATCLSVAREDAQEAMKVDQNRFNFTHSKAFIDDDRFLTLHARLREILNISSNFRRLHVHTKRHYIPANKNIDAGPELPSSKLFQMDFNSTCPSLRLQCNLVTSNRLSLTHGPSQPRRVPDT